MGKSLTERVACSIENNKKAEADGLREVGLVKYVIIKSVSEPVSGIIGLGVGVGIAAFIGEAMDHVPYISTAVPEALKGLTNSDYFHGNLDKLGAALGFFGYYLRRTAFPHL